MGGSGVDGLAIDPAILPYAVLVITLVVLALLGAIVYRPGRAAAVPALDPGPPTLATGGSWRPRDRAQLVLEPDRAARIEIVFVPDSTFEARSVAAALVATETWWVWNTYGRDGDRETDRERRTETICTIPPGAAELPGGGPPFPFRKGERHVLAFEFGLDGLVPSTAGDLDVLACAWELAISIDRPLGPDPGLVQPVVVTQPRDRLNSGIVSEKQFSRYEETVARDGDVEASIRVWPAPLDLAAPATVDVMLRTDVPVRSRSLRAEILAEVRVTDANGDGCTQSLWSGERRLHDLPVGETRLSTSLAPLGCPFPDVDLPHGTIRGRLRLTLDRPAVPDAHFERDLCLCLEKPAGPGHEPAR